MEQERIAPASEHGQHTLPLALGNIFRAEGGLTNRANRAAQLFAQRPATEGSEVERRVGRNG